MASSIRCVDGKLLVPDEPIIPFIEGDGIGPEIWHAAVRVLDDAVRKAYGGKRHIVWQEALAGEKAFAACHEWLPAETLDAIRAHRVAIKGPLTTPVGGGIRSLNVTLRQTLDLYACVRPVRWIKGTPSPVHHPEWLDIVIFRENTEDIYAGIEWPAGSPEAGRLRALLQAEFGVELRHDAGVGIKPISESSSKRLIRAAIRYAIEHRRPSVTLVHKGNIMKYTEGAFRDWGYQIAREEFPEQTISRAEAERSGIPLPDGRVLIQDTIADNMFQNLLLWPRDHSVLATTNLNGDYLSDASAAVVGGLGMAPGANIGDGHAIFEATHGTAPSLAGQEKVNPTSVILSGVMMLEYIGWPEAAEAIVGAVERTVAEGVVTHDLARQLDGVHEVSTSAFGEAVLTRL